jgi:hypothetical protein
MKIEHAIAMLTPGQLEVAKQNWRRDPSTWRRAFLLTHLTPKLDGIDPEAAAPIRARWNEVADALEAHFNELLERLQVVRGLGLKFYEAPAGLRM